MNNITSMLGYISPFFFGTWILRVTNDPNFSNGATFLEIRDNYKLALCTKYNDIIIGKTDKRRGYIVEKNTNTVDILFTEKEIYSYSILGFEIPKTSRNIFTYKRPKRISVKKESNSLLIKNRKYFYIFDLYIRSNVPPIETRWNNFIFIQIISFLFNLLIIQAIHLSTNETKILIDWFSSTIQQN